MSPRFTPPPNWPPTPDGWEPPAGWQPDPSWGPAPERWNFYPDPDSDAATQQFAAVQDEPDTWDGAGVGQGTRAGKSRRKFPKWLVYAAAGLVIFLLGLGLGGASSSAETRQPVPADTVAAAQSDELENVGKREEAVELRESGLQDLEIDIEGREDAVAAAEAQLKLREEAVGKREADEDAKDKEAAAVEAANTIAGEGISLVNSQVQPGTYQTSGNNGCYWARLSGTTGDFKEILANDNVDGDSVVTILPTDVAFERSGCKVFTKIG